MSLALNGTNQYLSIADSALLTLTPPYSCSLWARRTVAYREVLDYLWSRGSYTTNPSVNFWLRASHSTNPDRLQVSVRDSDGDNVYFDSGSAFADDTDWHHICITCTEGGLVKIWIDGAVGNSATNANLGAIDQTTLALGARFDGNAYWFAGKIAEPSTFDLVLPKETVIALAGGASPGDYSPVWWRKLLSNSTDGAGELTITEVNSPSFDAADHPVSYGVAAMALENQFVAPFMRSQFVR